MGRGIITLVVTMNQKDHSLLEKMHIQTDAVVANQCGENSIEDFEWQGHHVIYVNSDSKGVGLNRNNAIEHADADICVLADDDLVYVDGYADIVRRAFDRHKDADVIAFNLYEQAGSRFVAKKDIKIGKFNFGRYGAARLAVRLSSIIDKGIMFNEHFGGGTEYSCGEDTIFLHDCLKNGLNIYAVPEFIAELKNERSSTWFHGYDDKFFRDKGVLYKELFPTWWRLIVVVQIIRHRNLYREYGIWKGIKKALLQEH